MLSLDLLKRPPMVQRFLPDNESNPELYFNAAFIRCMCIMKMLCLCGKRLLILLSWIFGSMGKGHWFISNSVLLFYCIQCSRRILVYGRVGLRKYSILPELSHGVIEYNDVKCSYKQPTEVFMLISYEHFS